MMGISQNTSRFVCILCRRAGVGALDAAALQPQSEIFLLRGLTKEGYECNLSAQVTVVPFQSRPEAL